MPDIAFVKRSSFLRGIGFRLAAMTMLLVLVSIASLGTVIYSFVKTSFETRLKQQIAAEMASLLATRDPSQIIADVETRSSPAVNSLYSYRVTKADGQHVVGDVWLTPGAVGWTLQDPSEKARFAWIGGRVIKLTAPLDNGMTLTIGRDISWLTEVERDLLVILGLALVGGGLLSVITAFLAHRTLSRRLKLIGDTAKTIMAGDLSRRVPLTGAMDDFDRLSATLNEMLARNEQLLANLRQVTDDIAHDLRTPLGRLRQLLELARAELDSPQASAALIERAEAEADGLLVTFSALLRIAQIEAGEREAGMRLVDLSRIAATVVEAYELAAAEGGRTLASSIVEGLTISGDPDLLPQLFANLIENGLAHTPIGSRITVALKQAGEGVEATVDDDGPGVPAAERERIFRRLYRLERSRSTPGSGLGLSLVAAIAKLHGATVVAEDNRPGLRIRIFFPAASEPAGPA